MRVRAHAFIAVLLLVATAAPFADDIVRRELKSIKGRTYFLFVPPAPQPGETFPFLITLHGSNRDGRSLVERWRPLAREQRLVVAGPDAADRRGWRMPVDGPDALYFLVQEIAQEVPIDQRRMYIFGHSAGAIFGITMGLVQSEYFAAVSIHAGAIDEPNADALLKSAARKIPFQIQVGTDDPFFPLDRVRATRDRLQSAGFDVSFSELARHNHAYYDRAASINKAAWAFLSTHRLAADPKYITYAFR